jgi:hypothetical protein
MIPSFVWSGILVVSYMQYIINKNLLAILIFVVANITLDTKVMQLVVDG